MNQTQHVVSHQLKVWLGHPLAQSERVSLRQSRVPLPAQSSGDSRKPAGARVCWTEVCREIPGAVPCAVGIFVTQGRKPSLVAKGFVDGSIGTLEEYESQATGPWEG